MKKTLRPSRWIVCFFAGILAIVFLLSSIIYLVDPCFQFRFKNNTHIIEGRFVNTGLIRNYDYDLMVVGSSMTQNFHMDLFRETMDVKPLHVNISGMKPYELAQLINLAIDEGKAQQIIANAFFGGFSATEDNKIPSYLLKEGPLSTLQYFLSYEVWFRYLPANFLLAWERLTSKELSAKTQRLIDVDYLGNWENGTMFGKKHALKAYKSSKPQPGMDDSEKRYKRLTDSVDNFFAMLKPTDAEISFFFPPYSALYWVRLGEKLDLYLDAKDYFIEKATSLGHTVYDFTAEDYTLDLSRYKDVIHYDGKINDEMTLCFANGENIATPENMGAYREKLLAQLEGFREKYAEEL